MEQPTTRPATHRSSRQHRKGNAMTTIAARLVRSLLPALLAALLLASFGLAQNPYDDTGYISPETANVANPYDLEPTRSQGAVANPYDDTDYTRHVLVIVVNPYDLAPSRSAIAANPYDGADYSSRVLVTVVNPYEVQTARAQSDTERAAVVPNPYDNSDYAAIGRTSVTDPYAPAVAGTDGPQLERITNDPYGWQEAAAERRRERFDDLGYPLALMAERNAATLAEHPNVTDGPYTAAARSRLGDDREGVVVARSYPLVAVDEANEATDAVTLASTRLLEFFGSDLPSGGLLIGIVLPGDGASFASGFGGDDGAQALQVASPSPETFGGTSLMIVLIGPMFR